MVPKRRAMGAIKGSLSLSTCTAQPYYLKVLPILYGTGGLSKGSILFWELSVKSED